MIDSNFDDLSDHYEALVDWPKRLANEAPLLRRLFASAGVQRVVDVACGTGHHAAQFHEWGLEVEAADVSQIMIERSKARFGQPPGLRWIVRSFDQATPETATFDAAICLGNSLALAPDKDTVAKVMQCMLAAVRPGGLVLVQLLNLWRYPEGPCQWQKCVRASFSQNEIAQNEIAQNEIAQNEFAQNEIAQNDTLLLKGVSRCGPRGFVQVVAIGPESPPTLRSDCAELLTLEAHELQTTVQQSGGRLLQLLGNYQGDAYDRAGSVDMILVVERLALDG